MFFKKQNYVKVYSSPNSNEQFGLIAINGKIKDALLTKFNETYQSQGSYFNNGGKASDKCMRSILATGTGALGLSSAASGTLFMATVNPATLMTLRNGVGSAVMGSGGIVAQAPFIPISGALMPVAAPLLAYQAVSTITIMQQFETINEKLANIEKTLNRILHRSEATYIGEIISSSARLNSIETEYSLTNYFSQDMIIRLTFIENTINTVFERYKFLYESLGINSNLLSEDIDIMQTDAIMVTILSILDLRIDTLRIKISLQENPGFMKILTEQLIEKIERYKILWSNIEQSPKKIQEITQSMSQTINNLNWWKKQMPGWIGGNRKLRKESEKNIFEINQKNMYSNTEEIINGAKEAINIGNNLLDQAQQKQQMLLYWEDLNGVHSYYTNEISIS
ncbi:hypothetical protein JYG23_08755 [Sedimentibacter sp. zth1]|uniref:hypothetical protein n=1 Tax=Sedimentibacter sp. zth1 TaxID=2816908 RepID=UPI001A9168E1|nr:hypothetical protein [Sedimentibacter sp. zth1]QSX04796.1 hypothetical protein JYG23_08755 [Sedimentibacter sp. zth1]